MSKKHKTTDLLFVEPRLAGLVDRIVVSYHGYAMGYGDFPIFEKDPRVGFCEELFRFVVTDDEIEIPQQDRGLVLLMARVAISTLYS